MNLFEKIFNYQVISRLEESGTIAVTAQERAWLRTMLAHPAAKEAFEDGTRRKLEALLEAESAPDLRDILIEKARSRERHVYHPLLRPLRRLLMNGQGIWISYRLKNGTVNEGQSGFPCKLEYSMVKREWYLLWYHTRRHALMATKLANISSVEEKAMPAPVAEKLRQKVAGLLESRKRQAVVEVVPAYNEELSRILYAFSCFEKEVSYDEAADVYRIQLTYQADESEFVLSKIRFLGLRVRVKEGRYLLRRMAEASSKALARYGQDGAEPLPETAADQDVSG